MYVIFPFIILCFSYRKHIESGQSLYSIIGYLTLYKYFAYPDKIRPRIRYFFHITMYTASKHFFSQMLILPPYQKQHHGSKLHNAQ